MQFWDSLKFNVSKRYPELLWLDVPVDTGESSYLSDRR